jgi:hypothetical protein
MKRLGHVVIPSILMILVGLTASASAGERVKHSGVIVSIADDQNDFALFPHLTVFGKARTFLLAELGPWQVRNGATVITYRTITLAPETEFAMVARADAAPSGFGGDFVETRLGPEGVYLNDYVTIDCRHEGKRLVAVKITVTELLAPETEGGIPR